MLLPMAARIVVEPGALVMLHLGPDAAYLTAFERRRSERLERMTTREGPSEAAATARDAAEHETQRQITTVLRKFIERYLTTPRNAGVESPPRAA